MNLLCLHEPPPVWLGEALEKFEAQFSYPLGNSQRFRISHGRAYLPFFQAMGRASVLVAERSGEVLGTLARVERTASIGNDSRLLHYLCDLKVAPAARGSRALMLLIQETRRQIEASGSRACYSIVMRGTGRTPLDYTGRSGVPPFEKLGEILVLRCSPAPDITPDPPEKLGAAPGILNDAAKTPPVRIRITGGQSALRSILDPILLRHQDASGLLEDTRRGKRLWLDGGPELVSAHLSNAAFESPASFAGLLRRATEEAGQAGLPSVFTALPASLWLATRPFIRGLNIQESPADIHGWGLPPGLPWWVDTAEI